MNLRHALLILSGFICLQVFEVTAAPRQPSPNRECATCHIMWLNEFKREDVETLIPYDPKPVLKTGQQDIASSEDICFSCHDGFVLESRFLWEPGKHAHPVGQKPSEKITIPVVDGKNLFPLNDDGRMYCGTCHSAHGVDWDDNESAIFMRVRDVDGQLCMACHKDKTEGPVTGMHPVGKKVEKVPAVLKQHHAKFGRDNEVVCQSCHQPHAAPEKKILRLENKNSELCGSCHDDRYAMTMDQAAVMKTHPVNIVPENVTVPESLKTHGAKHGDNQTVICQTCHRPHEAATKQGLLVSSNEKGALCQSCHVDKKTVLETKHDMNLVDEDSENSRGEKVKDHGACSACHLPHKGNGAKMWARKVDATQEPMAALCLSCHREQGLAEKHTVGKYSHPVGADIKNLGRKVKLPTFDEKGIKWVDVMQGKVSCASCHDPHQWDANDKHHKAEPGDDGDNTNRFLRIANGSDAKLCRTCHIDKWNIASTKHDMRIMAPDATNTRGQTVEESGLCGACHLVHNANGSKLWARTKLDDGQGTGYVACIGCHNEKGLAKNKTLGKHSHPLNVPVTRLGIEVNDRQWSLSEQRESLLKQKQLDSNMTKLQSLPLYTDHGLPADHGGQVGCGSCHDPHNWRADQRKTQRSKEQIKNEEGDANSSFLRIADNGRSQLCVNCHQDKRTVFETRHDLSQREIADGKQFKQLSSHRRSDKSDQQQASQDVTGACLHCHTPHNAGENALWARPAGQAKSPIGKMCSSCHAEQKIAANKLPGNHMHPVGVSIGDLEADIALPLFDSDGNRDGYQYRVDCASCHDPHQWDPQQAENRGLQQAGKTDGDTSNSFLRVTANANSALCLSCHSDKKTISGSDHEMSINSKNVLGQTRDVSGICGQCHIPHHAEADQQLWAQKVGPGQDAIEQRCRSCHSDGRLAESKNPAVGQHPKQIKVWSTKLRQLFKPDKQLADIRVFDENGKATSYGAITCASCHNPHQWQALHQHGMAVKQSPKKAGGPEGNVLNSFLRNSDSRNIVCADCHDKDGLYRYKYFHSDNTHPAETKQKASVKR